MAVESPSTEHLKLPIRRFWSRVIATVAWGAGIYGVLLLADTETPFSCAMCGPWGCFPPLEALVAWHTGWLMVLTPALFWARRNLLRSTTWTAVGAMLENGGRVPGRGGIEQ